MTDPGQAGQPAKWPQAPAAQPQAPAAQPQPQAAQPSLPRTPGRKARRQHLQVVVLGIASVLTLLVSTGAWAVTSYVSGSLGRVNAGTAGTPESGPLNILVAGIDSRSGLTRRQEIALHVGNDVSMNSDTLMLVHVSADHSSVQVVSLPRDSWVDIPGHGMSKINAAIGLGGIPLMVQTVEHVTGLTINDFIEVNFLGFVRVIDALGGVNICLPYAVDDSYTGLHLPAGIHHVDGITALKFARDRHSFAASDLARINDQQQLMSSLFTEATNSGLLANPFRLQQFLSSVTAAIKVDSNFNLLRMASELRGIRSQNVTFRTVPLASANYITPTGEDAVLWDSAAAHALFTSLRNDTVAAAQSHRRAARQDRLSRSKVSVDVYNGTWTSGLSATTGKQLAALGFTVHRAGLNWQQHNLARTVIQYPPGQLAAARLLLKVLPGATLQPASHLSRLRLILGVSGSAVRGGTGAVSSAPQAGGQAAVPGQTRTATQDACR
jgi:LCP family protein required for cell wall assembly